MDIHPDEEGEAKQVQVRFITKLQQPYKVQQASISIPANLTRFGLSALVNNLLLTSNADWTTEPFDFLIDGELVRMSLEEFLLAKGISAEKVLEIEYIKAVAPRNQEEPSLHDDWVSAVDGSNDGYILTGCYDDLGRVWKAGGICTHVLDGHSGPLTSVCNLMPKVDSIVGQVVATGSKDRTLRLWKFGEEDPIDQTKKIRSVKVLRGHTDAVQSIAAIPSGDVVCSGSWDCTINLWNTTANDPEDSVSVKKRKKGGQDKEALSEGEALTTLVGHTQCVSSVVWPQRETIYSGSWDHSIRRWDVETGKDSFTMSCGKAINSLSIGGESCALIAAGSSDPVLRVWDPRKPGTLSPIFQFSSHNSWISSCKWHDKSWYHLASASYDGKVMLWDLRTAWPLSVIDTHGDKVLCADWWKGDSVVSGGADSKLRISSGVSVM
ncbi:ribosome biogenesis protein WDR12 homolog isoform X1 [Salvia miltiorrhiza]|uniref:ribosome biogenesis protein WDR12 homolog isoform X1 n=1 Tax=Salvia miltiorrhiza TaxID=226208 RepID=UPI0025AD5BDE|nr:ribosome biogenesis protein WDR12 homolog isoform X1 [Salvia miltiorrhiza]XP_057807936.1 ribosome biogenesis protein WDR12 homolog isoform X1 [Salvia miltiorrhiza]XP_057807937.1 ribosome biogenesis protein WDR12 homolog isoform X1 [Salvia miltiorrhiza]XP_057807938.1 ribosome biogenesis protein WDR12 homolog isoform X1 [Salvia miltiorrhiza]XP_057807939.1 ribosome biogenesis protein WDR12 homolog isoform X1 [Salvia miltiorrhiza]XP_057807940.1 ribosome biogenesis protein WDR12 homolog isoform 